LTRGAHFRAVRSVLLERFPDRRVVGLFVARAVDPLPEDAFDVLDDPPL
jgi:hypothetical protein